MLLLTVSLPGLPYTVDIYLYEAIYLHICFACHLQNKALQSVDFTKSTHKAIKEMFPVHATLLFQ